MRLVALSDTHGKHKQVHVPAGDVLIFAGDFMNSGKYAFELVDFAAWFNNQPHKKKILVAGNHDRLVEQAPNMIDLYFHNVDYLKDSGLRYGGVNFWGSPYTPEFNNWAFNAPRATIKSHWNLIPPRTDVLITHGPPYGKCDGLYGQDGPHSDGHLGCLDLKHAVDQLGPLVHIFGHLHKGYGNSYDISTGYYNVSVCDEQYRVTNPVTVIDLGESNEAA